MEKVHLNGSLKHTTSTLQNDELTVSFVPSSGYRGVKATEGRSEGRRYFEIEVMLSSSGAYGVGICNDELDTSSILATGAASMKNAKFYINNTGSIFNPVKSGNATFFQSDVIGVAIDLDSITGVVEFYKNGILQPNFYDDVKTMGSMFFPLILASGGASPAININFGESPFKYQIPEGYKPYQLSSKILVTADDGAHTAISGIWENIGAIPTDLSERATFYETHGMDEILREQLHALPAAIPNGKGKVSVLRI